MLKTDQTALENIFKSLTQRPGYLLRRCLQETSSAFAKACAEIGITDRQYDYLFVLGQADRLTQGELSRLLGADRSTNALVIGILEKKGYVSRKIDRTDTRQKIIELTMAGKKALEKADGGAQVATDRLRSGLSDVEYKLLLNFLVKIHLFNERTV